MDNVTDEEVENILGAELELSDIYGNIWFPLKDPQQSQEIVYAMVRKGYSYDQSLDKGRIVTSFLKEVTKEGGMCKHKNINHSVCYAAFMAICGGAGEPVQ